MDALFFRVRDDFHPNGDRSSPKILLTIVIIDRFGGGVG
jgi:hypothetical protein